jgi:IS30 family transposase
MRIIYCTNKLLKELDVPLVELDKIPQPTEGLGNWYANLLRIDRRKCLIFTNEKSLYTFLIPKVLKANLKDIEQEFLINLSYNLQYEGFGLDVINRVMQEYQEIGFAKTMSKSVLGSMNNGLVRRYFPKGTDFSKIMDEQMAKVESIINNRPRKCLGYKTPLEVASAFVALRP